MGFSRQEYWSGLPFPSPGDLPDPGIEPGSPALEADALTSEPPGKSAGKESARNAGDLSSIPELGRSPGEGKGYPLQYSGEFHGPQVILEHGYWAYCIYSPYFYIFKAFPIFKNYL